jgi:methionyl-tRNA formyltransferase
MTSFNGGRGVHSQPDTETSVGRPISVVFFGTPEFAVPALRRLAGDSTFDVRLVVTQPDRPSGRGRRLASPPVRLVAEELALPVYQTDSLRTPELRAPVATVGADLFVVAAFGVIFGPKVLTLPRRGCVNIHASLLPAYRGASPISAAIACGESVTGVSLMVMDTGLDTGGVFATSQVPIDDTDTTETLTTKLAEAGAALAGSRLAGYVDGALVPSGQPREGASMTRPLIKADGWIDWTVPAHHIERLTRAMWPWPRAWTTLDGEPFQIHRCSVADLLVGASGSLDSGAVFRANGDLAVQCGDGAVILDRVQRAGGRPINGRELLRSQPYLEGARLGAEGGPSRLPGPLVTVLG